MKKFFLLLYLCACFTIQSFAQLTLSSVEGVSPGRNTTYTNPISSSSETRFIGLCYGKIEDPYSGGNVCYYSYDITKPAANCMPNYDYVDDSTTTALPKVVYIVYHYYPAAAGPGQLSNLNNESAAIQCAIWYYTNGLSLNSITSTTVRTRALAIVADADANGANTTVPEVLKIIPDMDPDYFLVQTLNDNGTGASVSNIILSITQGSLSRYSVNTSAPSGLSPAVQVIGTGSGIITARANDIMIPKGRLFRHLSNQCPKVILACSGKGTLRVRFDWGALPVEMASFTSSVKGRDVTLNWTTTSELNNKGFEIERQTMIRTWTKIGFVNGSGTSSSLHLYKFGDMNLESGRYEYRLKQLDYNGNFIYHTLEGYATVGAPENFRVSQNYPNPFNPTSKIDFDLPAEGNVNVSIFDVSGKLLMTVLNGYRPAGYYTTEINAGTLSSGIYFYRVILNGSTKNFVMTKKMNLIK